MVDFAGIESKIETTVKSIPGELSQLETRAAGIIRTAAQIVEGIRENQHGQKERSFTLIAQFWTSYLEGRKTNGPVTAVDVAQMMVLLKIARTIQGEAVIDHFVDQAGYSGIAGELNALQKQDMQDAQNKISEMVKNKYVVTPAMSKEEVNSSSIPSSLPPTSTIS